MEFAISSTIDTDELIYDMQRYLSTEEVIQFVIDLDLQAANWDFTERLYKYFKDQHKIFKAEL